MTLPPPPFQDIKLSVIIPALNEARNIGPCIEALGNAFAGEILVADGGSTDGTPELARQAGAKVLSLNRGLATQCNEAAAFAQGNILFFLAADSRVPSHWYSAISQTLAFAQVVGGGFRLELDHPHPGFRIIEWGGNFRSSYLNIALPDQGLFVRKEAFETVGGMQPQALIPYARLCFDLGRVGEFRLVNASMKSSARKWLEQGMFTTSFRHAVTYLRFKYSPF